MGKQNKLSKKQREERRLMYETPAHRPAPRRTNGHGPLVLEMVPERDNRLVRLDRRFQQHERQAPRPAQNVHAPRRRESAAAEPAGGFQKLQRKHQRRANAMQAELS